MSIRINDPTAFSDRSRNWIMTDLMIVGQGQTGLDAAMASRLA
jgi:hypothetical protein